MLFALTREISSAFQDCQLTHVPRVPIDLERARAQHDAYEWALVELGCTVRRIDSGPDMPDAVFIEDIGVVIGRTAIVTRPGAESRRREMPAVAEALARFGLRLHHIEEPGTLDGGDVLVTTGGDVFIGASARTNSAGIDQARRILKRLRYEVHTVRVQHCLHLKSAATAVGPDSILINRDWAPPDAFGGLTLIDVDPDEPHGANALLIGEVVIYPAAFPKTRRRLESHGIQVRTLELDELAKAEGAASCCSVLIEVAG
jgi:dimethylargininase